ncbi:MAG: tRNA 2-thiouridine(34) synthase MnmA [Planctomycetes bacterium]|nr:tRNA 2-thiouridine(34) synthase MnmA [Planctomycetota bacterium]
MRVVVAMSGGVDSSVAALRLRDAGHHVTGVFLRNGIEAGGVGKGQGCCGATDARDAEEVAAALSIPFYALDHAAPFRRVIDDFVAAWARGETPNPCVQCNRELKFGALLEFATRMGAERLATGHYAAVEASGGSVVLRRARDRAKDQSYVLATVERAALARALFPLAELEKGEVREAARRAGLPVHAKPESQEICFVPSGDYRDLLRERRPDLLRPGTVRALDGTPLGQHGGAAGFTVGQRKGLALAGGVPRFVVRTDPVANEVVVGSRDDLQSSVARLRAPNFLIDREEVELGEELLLQVRAHHALIAATVAECSAERVVLQLAPPGEVLTPGQVAVAYRADRVLFAGTLERS